MYKWLFLPQHFQHLPVQALKKRVSNDRTVIGQTIISKLRFKDTAVLYPPTRSKVFQKRSQLFYP